MKHIDHKILELYVLNDDAALKLQSEIEQHLAECAGCREVHARMQDLYAGFFDTMSAEKRDSVPSELPVKSKRASSLTKSSSPLREVRTNYEIDRNPQRIIVSVVKKHPLITSSISLFVLGFFVIVGLQYFKTTAYSDENPNYFRVTSASIFEIYNIRNQLLWKYPLLDQINEPAIQRTVAIQDLDHDGKNEVITCLRLGNLNNGRQLLVLNGKGELVNSLSLNDSSAEFRGKSYPVSHKGISQVFTISNNNTTDIIVTVSLGFSPQYLLRLDAKLNALGEYWHFGGFYTSCKSITINNSSVIVAPVKNDIDDAIMKNYSALIVLDPIKIVGRKESSVTTGFGLQKSNAELCYIKFPESDIESALHIKSDLNLSEYDAKNNVLTIQQRQESNSNIFGFIYTLNLSNYTFQNIKFITGTEWTHQKLNSEGKLTTVFNDQYLNNLMGRVEYWDGKTWTRSVSHVVF